MSPADLPDELAALVAKLYPTELLRDADEGGGVRLSFITNNRLYQLEVQTEDSPNAFTLTAGTVNLFMEAPPGGMQAFVAAMRKKFPSANYGPRGPHGADFSASALGRKLPGPKLEAEFLRCKQVVDLCLDGQSRVAFDARSTRRSLALVDTRGEAERGPHELNSGHLQEVRFIRML